MSYPYQIKSYDEYKAAYKKSVEEPDAFWGSIAEHFQWKKKWDSVLEWNFKEPKVEWFKGAKLNITENCIDRHLETMGDKPAIIWEPNNPEERVRVVTYNRLHKRVCQFAQVLINNGVKKGDRVCIYMGMVPELAYAVLGCARIGAIHSVIFGGFSAQSIADRLYDAQAEFIVTCDGAYRGGKDIPLKSVIDDALIGNRTPPVSIVITYDRVLLGSDIAPFDCGAVTTALAQRGLVARAGLRDQQPGHYAVAGGARTCAYSRRSGDHDLRRDGLARRRFSCQCGGVESQERRRRRAVRGFRRLIGEILSAAVQAVLDFLFAKQLDQGLGRHRWLQLGCLAAFAIIFGLAVGYTARALI